MREIGIYIHIPFCKSKCIYCDFNSYVKKEDCIDEYINAVKEEIEKYSQENNSILVKTIYIGGGTPSYIKEKYIKKIIEALKNNFNIHPNAEITIEVNPGTVNRSKLELYYKIGINRLSIGFQSANDRLLKLIGRIHDFEDFLETIKLANTVGFSNINADCIIGLPNQNIYDVEETLNVLIDLRLTHISVYSLIVEPNTPLESKINSGELKLPDEEIERYMYWFSKRKLEENGYLHYEISNFSKPLYRSRHNLDYWNQKEYKGFGVSASSYENGVRYTNISDINKYIKNVKEKKLKENYIIEEKQDRETMMKEYMLLGLRKITGVNITEFRRKFGTTPLYKYNKEITKLIREELIEANEHNIRLSKKGLDLANLVWEEFIWFNMYNLQNVINVLEKY